MLTFISSADSCLDPHSSVPSPDPSPSTALGRLVHRDASASCKDKEKEQRGHVGRVLEKGLDSNQQQGKHS
jgi:hypothetical protein